MEIVQTEGERPVKRLKEMYNLDVIIAVGYRVNSMQATKFRIWATGVLREYLIKGFALDDERLKKGGKLFDRNYFDELLERIREIRTSERMFYQKLTDLFAQSVDYDRDSPTTKEFYASILTEQNAYTITLGKVGSANRQAQEGRLCIGLSE